MKSLLLVLSLLSSVPAFAWTDSSCEPTKCIGCAVLCQITENGKRLQAVFTQEHCDQLVPQGDRAQCATKLQSCLTELGKTMKSIDFDQDEMAGGLCK